MVSWVFLVLSYRLVCASVDFSLGFTKAPLNLVAVPFWSLSRSEGGHPQPNQRVLVLGPVMVFGD